MVRELVTHLGDIHHLFPREHLKKAGMTRALPDQIAALAPAFENFLAAYDREQAGATLNVKRLTCRP